MVEESKNWQVDKPFDIKLKGLYFIKTKRHIESLALLNNEESDEIGKLIKKYSTISNKKAKAKRVVTMSLGFKDPHIHFWVLPIKEEDWEYGIEISNAMKKLADKYRS